MSMSSNQSGTSFGNRPNRVCDGNLNNPTVQKWFDTSCFARPRVGVLGNAARTTLFGPGRWNLDMSVPKKFEITEQSPCSSAPSSSTSSTTRNSRPPSTSVGSPPFGVIQSTVKSSRQVQFALKYVF